MNSKLHIFVTCVCALLIGACTCAHAQAPGQSCTTAIPMSEDFSVQITSPQTVWYTAWTFDLPLTVTFAPQNNNTDPAYAPIVEMDFTCTPGIYEDSILCSLFCASSGESGLQFDMPHKPSLNTDRLDDGTFVYYLSLGKQYRDLLLRAGINYNLQVFVKVTFRCPGQLELAPDDLFSNCVDGAKFMQIGDTFNVETASPDRHAIIPFVQWQEDTIICKWTGTAPCYFAIANTCDFDPTDALNDNIIFRTQNPMQPGDSVKMSATNIYRWVHDPEYPNEAGMYFAKFKTTADGYMKFTKAAQAPVRGNATLLRFDQTYALNANETALFAIPDSWKDDTLNTQFVSPTEHIFQMEIANDPDFSEEHTLKKYQFEKTATGEHWQGILASEMKTCWNRTNEQYLYIRFTCSEATTVTPSKWFVSSCYKNTNNYIHSLDTTFVVKRASTGGNYKLNYAQWVGGDLTLTFTPAKKCSVYVAVDCNISLSFSAPNLLYYKQLTVSNNTVTISADEIASWADRVDEEGYIYIRYHHTENGTYNMHMQSTAPAESDPVYPSATIALACAEDGHTELSVSEDQPVKALSESGLSFDWNAEAGTPVSLADLPNGNYTVSGSHDTIAVTLPSAAASMPPVQRAAGITPDMPTRVVDTVMLSVQSGSNYIRFQPINFPVVITYLADTAFGPKPVAYMDDEELPAQAVFTHCSMGWKWEVASAQEASTIEIKAHENASLFVEPYVCPESDEQAATAWDSLVWRGTTYTESGEYVLTETNDHGCEWTHTLNLTIRHTTYQNKFISGCEEAELDGKTYTESGTYYDTIPTGEDRIIYTIHVNLGICPKDSFIYFCEGLNYEHVVEGDGYVITYKAYRYEEPSIDQVISEAVVTREKERTLVDLKKAEENLYAHYTNGLTPVKSVIWRHRPEGSSAFTTLTVSDEPQWITAGTLALSVRFVCGESFYSDFATDIDAVRDGETGRKAIIDGQLVIIRGGIKYSVMGQKINEDR